jgi:hypothetical protein
MIFKHNPLLGNTLLPVDIVLAPEWWNKNEGITFDHAFFFNPLKRVEDFGMGLYKNSPRPEIGAVHLAAGFIISEMMGCQVNYSETHPPQVLPANNEDLFVNTDEVFRSVTFNEVIKLSDALKKKYGYLTGDINWGGILNIAIDLRGQDIFLDMLMKPDEVKTFFTGIATVIEKFTSFIFDETGSTSISVNRNVRHMKKPVLLHSECSHTMISEEDYKSYLLPFDQQWSKRRPFGIHYCGPDPHRMAASFAQIPHLDYLDLGWGGDVKILREHLPDTFFNIRLSPVEIIGQSNNEIHETIVRLVYESGNPYLTGICCINMDDSVPDVRISTIFETVNELRKEYSQNYGLV